MAEEHDEIPYVFARNPIIEETAWSDLGGGDFYPTLSVRVGAEEWDEDTVQTSGLSFTTDFDTSSPNLFFLTLTVDGSPHCRSAY